MEDALHICQMVTTQLFLTAFKAPGSSIFITHTIHKLWKLSCLSKVLCYGVRTSGSILFLLNKAEWKKKTSSLLEKKLFQIKVIIGLLHIIKPPSKQTAHTLKVFPSRMPDLQNKFRPVPSTHFFPVCKCDTIRPHMQASLSNTGRTFVRYVDVFPPKPLT